MEFKVIGLKLHYLIGKTVKGQNCEFIYSDTFLPNYFICLKDNSGKCYEIELATTYGQCFSGWTTASWGRLLFKKVDNFGALTHSVKSGTDTKLLFDSKKCENKNELQDYQCNWFSYSYNGGDQYYPHGYAKVNMDRFTKLPRGFNEHPTWIFQGSSALGKSYLAHKTTGLIIFETDSYDILPDTIMADIVVLGNKHHYDLEIIKGKIQGKIITVDFNESLVDIDQENEESVVADNK